MFLPTFTQIPIKSPQTGAIINARMNWVFDTCSAIFARDMSCTICLIHRHNILNTCCINVITILSLIRNHNLNTMSFSCCFFHFSLTVIFFYVFCIGQLFNLTMLILDGTSQQINDNKRCMHYIIHMWI